LPSPEQIVQVVSARTEGLTLRESAARAGVHIATVCRWQARDQDLRKRLLAAARVGWRVRHLGSWGPRPRVRWRRDCPKCNGPVGVRTAPGHLKFWYCTRLHCGWASWRPRAMHDCPRCHQAMLWSHSRKSVGCSGCGFRLSV
jgi:hypothetical protein